MKNSTIDILLIEDNVQEADHIQELLAKVRTQNYAIRHARYLADGLILLRDSSFDVIILDLGLPDSQGLATVEALLKQEKRTPVVVLTSFDDEDTALASLKMDVQDYLIKSEINGRMLSRSIRYAIERKHAIEEMRRSEMKFSTIFHAAPVPMAISMPVDGTIINVNKTLLATCGYEQNEMVNRTANELCIWDNPADRDALIQSLFNQGPVRDREIHFRDKSGDLITGLLSAELIEIAGENYMLSLVKDITEQKRTEAEIKQLNAALESRAAELESSNEELAAFNYTISHDLRIPLSNIHGACQVIEMLNGEKFDKESKEYLYIVLDEIKRMSRLITTLLQFSNTSHKELRRDQVDLGKIARVVSANLRLTMPERQATFTIADGLLADGDPELLTVVMENLLGNAWKYTGEQEQAVIEFGSVESDGTKAYFVRDNGPGFDIAEVNNLFKPFKRLPGTVRFKGHGVGLATVERVIRRHGGTVWAEGVLGKGATFFFTLGPQSER